jgi:hypothetical protein
MGADHEAVIAVLGHDDATHEEAALVAHLTFPHRVLGPYGAMASFAINPSYARSFTSAQASRPSPGKAARGEHWRAVDLVVHDFAAVLQRPGADVASTADQAVESDEGRRRDDGVGRWIHE